MEANSLPFTADVFSEGGKLFPFTVDLFFFQEGLNMKANSKLHIRLSPHYNIKSTKFIHSLKVRKTSQFLKIADDVIYAATHTTDPTKNAPMRKLIKVFVFLQYNNTPFGLPLVYQWTMVSSWAGLNDHCIYLH